MLTDCRLVSTDYSKFEKTAPRWLPSAIAAELDDGKRRIGVYGLLGSLEMWASAGSPIPKGEQFFSEGMF
jgi:hypothetical protein